MIILKILGAALGIGIGVWLIGTGGGMIAAGIATIVGIFKIKGDS